MLSNSIGVLYCINVKSCLTSNIPHLLNTHAPPRCYSVYFSLFSKTKTPPIRMTLFIFSHNVILSQKIGHYLPSNGHVSFFLMRFALISKLVFHYNPFAPLFATLSVLQSIGTEYIPFLSPSAMLH